MMISSKIRHKMALAVTTLALRRLGRKRPYKGEVEEAVRRDWKTSMRRLGLRRHMPWHDRFRRSWLRLHRGS
ncbi:MAG: hypothetical protein GWP05_09285 [Anaerolineaceae bacterium]|nr:hypothetical protein [Anaerolineaceae bacterium]